MGSDHAEIYMFVSLISCVPNSVYFSVSLKFVAIFWRCEFPKNRYYWGGGGGGGGCTCNIGWWGLFLLTLQKKVDFSNAESAPIPDREILNLPKSLIVFLCYKKDQQ